MAKYKIRLAKEEDHDAIWEIFREVIKSGDTYVFNPNTPKRDLIKLWLADNMHTHVCESGGKIIGTYIIKANHPGLGSHVANASYMVHPEFQGKGIGRAMCEHSLDEAIKLGFNAMQFNLVVSSNVAAVALWQKFGFEIIGTLPNAFDHSKLGLVDAHIMYKNLTVA